MGDQDGELHARLASLGMLAGCAWEAVDGLSAIEGAAESASAFRSHSGLAVRQDGRRDRHHMVPADEEGPRTQVEGP